MENHYYKYYKSQAKADGQIGFGGFHADQVHRGVRFQRGYGLGGILSNILRRIFPFVSTAVKKAGTALKDAGVHTMLKETAKDAGRSLVKAGLNTVNDGLQGKNISESLSSNFTDAGRHIAQKTVSQVKGLIGQDGEGRKLYKGKRKRENSRSNPKRRKRGKLNIFDRFGK